MSVFNSSELVNAFSAGDVKWYHIAEWGGSKNMLVCATKYKNPPDTMWQQSPFTQRDVSDSHILRHFTNVLWLGSALMMLMHCNTD